MGWWSEAVMGGDQPADIMADLQSLITGGWDFFDRMESRGLGPRSAKKIREHIGAKEMDTMIHFIETAHEGSDMAYQVFGVFLMRYGLPITDALMGRIIEACLNDKWAQKSDERLQVILSYLDDLYKYKPYKPTELSKADQGLLTKLFDHIEQGKPGLVNI